jgi:hypothetical protein
MSFGWSAGDIAAALTIIYNVIQALDDVDGAAGSYRKAVTFLRDMKRTLESLETLTAWNTYPTYAKEFANQAKCIRGPVEGFLNSVVKYEPSLGEKARKGHHRQAWRKLQWYVLKEDKVSKLKEKIEGHMQIVDTLIHQLTL